MVLLVSKARGLSPFQHSVVVLVLISKAKGSVARLVEAEALSSVKDCVVMLVQLSKAKGLSFVRDSVARLVEAFSSVKDSVGKLQLVSTVLSETLVLSSKTRASSSVDSVTALGFASHIVSVSKPRLCSFSSLSAALGVQLSLVPSSDAQPLPTSESN